MVPSEGNPSVYRKIHVANSCVRHSGILRTAGHFLFTVLGTEDSFCVLRNITSVLCPTVQLKSRERGSQSKI